MTAKKNRIVGESVHAAFTAGGVRVGSFTKPHPATTKQKNRARRKQAKLTHQQQRRNK